MAPKGNESQGKKGKGKAKVLPHYVRPVAGQPWTELGIHFSKQDHIENFNILDQRDITSTKFVNMEVLGKLQIKEDFLLLARRIGFGDIAEMGAPITSRRLTLEFLSSLELSISESGELITFQLFNQPLDLTYPQLCTVFGWDPESPLATRVAEDRLLTGFKAKDTWVAMTDDKPFNPSRSRSSHIIHPTLRYLHHFLVYCIWRRSEPGAMSNREMPALWFAMNPVAPGSHVPINFAEQFVNSCFNFRGSGQTREITIGGMVTVLAQSCVEKIDWPKVDRVGGGRSMSEKCLIHGFHWMEKHNDSDSEFIWYVGHRNPYIILPQPGVTRIEGSIRRNPFKFPSSLNQNEAPPFVEPQFDVPIPEAPHIESPHIDHPMGDFPEPSPHPLDQGQPSSVPHSSPGYDNRLDRLLEGQAALMSSMNALRLDSTSRFNKLDQRLGNIEQDVFDITARQQDLQQEFDGFFEAFHDRFFPPSPHNAVVSPSPSAHSPYYSPSSWEPYNQGPPPLYSVFPIPSWQQCSPWRDPQPAAPYYESPFPPPSPHPVPFSAPQPVPSIPPALSSTASFVPMDEDDDWMRHDAPSGDEA